MVTVAWNQDRDAAHRLLIALTNQFSTIQLCFEFTLSDAPLVPRSHYEYARHRYQCAQNRTPKNPIGGHEGGHAGDQQSRRAASTRLLATAS